LFFFINAAEGRLAVSNVPLEQKPWCLAFPGSESLAGWLA
jgi:hypothetical protein